MRVCDAVPEAVAYVHEDNEALPYVHEDIAAEPYKHEEIPAEAYVHEEPAETHDIPAEAYMHEDVEADMILFFLRVQPVSPQLSRVQFVIHMNLGGSIPGKLRQVIASK